MRCVSTAVRSSSSAANGFNHRSEGVPVTERGTIVAEHYVGGAMTNEQITMTIAVAGLALGFVNLAWNVGTWRVKHAAEKGYLRIQIRRGFSQTVARPWEVFADIVAVNHGSASVHVTAAEAKWSPFTAF